jgi:Rrf2 family cysteine metabolism transcriptional repressor
MRISSRGEYGLRALFDLAQHHNSAPIPGGDIAARQQIPEPYLNQLLLALRQAGLVRSVRGPQGGYALARRPASITLAEAVIALEGTYAPAEDLDPPSPPGTPPEAEILREIWRQVEAAIGEVLKSITLEELCQRKLAREQQIMYYI